MQESRQAVDLFSCGLTVPGRLPASPPAALCSTATLLRRPPQPSTATTYPKSLLDMTEPINGNELRTSHKQLPIVLQLLASFIMTTIFTFAWLGAAVPVAFLWRELAGLEW